MHPSGPELTGLVSASPPLSLARAFLKQGYMGEEETNLLMQLLIGLLPVLSAMCHCRMSMVA